MDGRVRFDSCSGGPGGIPGRIYDTVENVVLFCNLTVRLFQTPAFRGQEKASEKTPEVCVKYHRTPHEASANLQAREIHILILEY